MKGIVYFLAVILSLLLWPWPVAEGEPEVTGESRAAFVSVKVSVDRDYGYYIGDLVKASYTIVLPPHIILNEASLPKEHGSLNKQIDVRKLIIEKRMDHGYRAYRSYFVYQVFASSDRADFFEIPEIHFSYGPDANPSVHAAVLPALQIAISPLVPQGASFKPAIPWTRRNLFPGIIQWAGAALLLVSSLFLFDSIRKRLAAPSPFSAALKKLSRKQDAAAALVLFRTALNEVAGKAIFANNLDEFIRVFPPGTPYRDEIRELVLLSDEVSFNPEYLPEGDGPTKRIRTLIKKLRRGQRWH